MVIIYMYNTTVHAGIFFESCFFFNQTLLKYDRDLFITIFLSASQIIMILSNRGSLSYTVEMMRNKVLFFNYTVSLLGYCCIETCFRTNQYYFSNFFQGIKKIVCHKIILGYSFPEQALSAACFSWDQVSF